MLIASGATEAQDRLRFQNYSFRNGLSNPGVNCLFQDSTGFIWVGTNFGLNRFDGIGFRTWYHDPADTNSLPDNYVNAIAEDREHNIWIGTRGGVSCLNPYTGAMVNYSPRGKRVRHFEGTNNTLFIDSKNYVWIGHNQGIDLINEHRDRMDHIAVPLSPEGEMRNRFINAFIEQGEEVWCTTSYGMYRINRNSLKTQQISLKAEGGKGLTGAFTSIRKDRSNRVWIGSWFDGIVWYDPIDKKLHNNTFGEQRRGVMDVLPVYDNRGGQTIYAASGGVFRVAADSVIRGLSDPGQVFVHNSLDPYSLTTNNIDCLMEDRMGNIWIGSSNGLHKIDRQTNRFRLFSYENLVGNHFAPYAICNAHSQGKYWLLTGLNLILFDSRTGQFEVNNLDVKSIHVFDLIQSSGGYLIGCRNGLLRLDRNMKPLKMYDRETVFGKPLHSITSIYEDATGKLWLGSHKYGIYLFDPETGSLVQHFHREDEPVDLRGVVIRDVKGGKKGKVWIATEGGLYLTDASCEKAELIRFCAGASPCEGVQALYMTPKGQLFIGTREGLFRYDENDGSYSEVKLRAANSGMSRNVTDIQQDEKGNLWLTTTNGLVCFNPVNGFTRWFSENDGLATNDYYYSFARLDGRMLLGSDGNICVFDPAEVLETSIVPAPVFSNVSVNDRPIDWRQGTLIVSHNDFISLDFISLNFANPLQNRYEYQLGEKSSWHNLGNGHSLRLSNLSPGDYTLKIRSSMNGGQWSERVLTCVLTVLPPFWRTWWFGTLVLAVFFGLIYAWYRYRLEQALRLERLRTRIATDLHDDIGATLSSISMYSDVVKRQVHGQLPHLKPVLEKMGENSRQMVDRISDIVWAINPANDEVHKLADRIEAHARDLCSLHNIFFHFTVDLAAHEMNLSLDQRKNIYLIFKEAINNSLKYANATNIWLGIEKKQGALHLTIRDDGQGFDMADHRSGQGLKNMQARASDIRGRTTIISAPGEGTAISLVCNIT